MAERIVHLSIDKLFDGNHNHPDIPEFISEFSTNLYSGDGKKPEMLERMAIGPDLPVRLLVGVPQKSLTREQRLIAEAFVRMIFGRETSEAKSIWSYGKGWRPSNPAQQPALLKDSRLDTDFMLSLGISKAVWRNDILMAPTAFEASCKPRATTLTRYLFALVAFGFSDPYPFFTRNDDSEGQK